MKKKIFVMTLLMLMTLICTSIVYTEELTPINSELEVMPLKDVSPQQLISMSEGYIIFSSDEGKFGYLDRRGEEVIPAIFDVAEDFSDGMARVEIDGELAYINTLGQIEFFQRDVEKQFQNVDILISDFNSGRARIQGDYNGQGYTDKEGNYVTNIGKYLYVSDFSDDVAYVEEYVSDEDGDIYERKIYAIDTEGNILFELNQEFIYSPFKNGRAVVKSIIGEYYEYSFIDKTGYLIRPFNFDSLRDFEGEYAVYFEEDGYGVVNNQGDIVIKPLYKKLKTLENGFVVGYDGFSSVILNNKLMPIELCLGNIMDEENYTGFLVGNVLVEMSDAKVYIKDYSNKKLGSFQFLRLMDNHTFLTTKGEIVSTESVEINYDVDLSIPLLPKYQFEFIDKNGHVVLDMSEYSTVHPFSQGLALVEKNGKYGYINLLGEEVIPTDYSIASSFEKGMAYVQQGNKSKMIDLQGNEITEEPLYEWIAPIDETDYEIVQATDNYYSKGILDKSDNRLILALDYEEIDYLGNDLFELTYDGVLGLYDAKNDLLIAPNFDYLRVSMDGERIIFRAFSQGDFYGLMDFSEQVIIEPVYTHISEETSGIYQVMKDDQYGLFDKFGNEIMDNIYNHISLYIESDSINIYAFYTGDLITEYIVYDLEKEKIISKVSGKWSHLKLYDEKFIESVDSEDRSIIRNLEGEVIIEENVSSFAYKDGFFMFLTEAGTTYLVDRYGKKYLENNVFDVIYFPVFENHIVFEDKNGYGLVSLDGEIKTKTRYMDIGFADGILRYNDGKSIGYMDVKGKDLLKENYYLLYDFSDGYGLGVKIRQ